MPFPLRAKRARRSKTAPEPHRAEDGFANFSDFEPPQQARRTGEDDELPRESERFLQPGQPEDEPYY